MKNFLKNKKGFTLIELIVVIVIMAILGGIGFSALSNYIASANLSKIEQEFSELRNGIGPKFTKSFIDNGVSWSVEAPSATAGVGFLSGATVVDPIDTALTADLLLAGKTISVNGISVRVIEVAPGGQTLVNAAMASDSGTNTNDVDNVLFVGENGGEVTGTFVKKVKDFNLCSSKAFTEKVSGDMVYTLGATPSTNYCTISTKIGGIKMLSVN